jgi:hypothetical protein
MREHRRRCGGHSSVVNPSDNVGVGSERPWLVSRIEAADGHDRHDAKNECSARQA